MFDTSSHCGSQLPSVHIIFYSFRLYGFRFCSNVLVNVSILNYEPSIKLIKLSLLFVKHVKSVGVATNVFEYSDSRHYKHVGIALNSLRCVMFTLRLARLVRLHKICFIENVYELSFCVFLITVRMLLWDVMSAYIPPQCCVIAGFLATTLKIGV